MSEVNSNYNFVPALNEAQVFHPDWRNQVSHDIPFSDGESGIIKISLTAKTPIFIRNGHVKDQVENEFSHLKKEGEPNKYFIPGTSIKGMVRNVLEILGRGRIKQINNHKYSFRDLTRNSLYMRSYESNKVECGWLFEDDEGNWKIKDCQKPLRISHEDLDPILNTHFRRAFLNKNPVDKTAKYKYNQVSNKLTHRFGTKKEEYKTLAVLDNNGQEGTIVLTGQSSKRKEEPNRRPSGKLYEFVFLKPKANLPLIEITEQQKIDFKFIYLDHDQNNISKDWKFWKEKLAKGEEMPVFFNRNGTNGVKHFGLAYMYKLPYKNSIHEMLPFDSYKENFHKKDLVETIFGTTDKEAGILKGRVMISHAFSDNAIPSEKVIKEILAGPKASYFPFYLNQNGDNTKYKTYENSGVEIRGFKRYPIHTSIKTGNYDQKQLSNPKVFSSFKPLKSGAHFVGTIRFHNLRKAEIGALLSALTFHQQGDNYYHSIGAAKPLGYGKLALRVENLQYLDHTVEDYLLAFEELMENEFPDWLNAPALNELFAMAADPKKDDINNELVYPKIKVPNAGRGEDNEFVNYKKDNLILPSYSEINGTRKLIPLAQKIETNQMMTSGTFEIIGKNVREVKAYLKSKNIEAIPDNFKPDLISKVGDIYNTDRKSKKDWNKQGKTFLDLYEWKTIITNWIGEEKAFELYKKITGKEN